VDENIGAQRIFKIQYKRQDESLKQDVEDLKNKLRKRIMDSDESFFKYYGVRFLDFSNYDLIINTTNLSIENVTNKILEKLR
jgi:cytidylate kinase